ncbi:MAG: hypothetical protein ACRD3V_10420 [Vicinamibacteria bacterium]
MRAESFFTVKGRRCRLLTLEDLSFDEALELDRISGGLAPGQVVDAFADLHPRAVLAMLTISIRRSHPGFSERELYGENLIDVVDTLETIRDEGDARPPEAGAPSLPERQPGDKDAPSEPHNESGHDGSAGSGEETPHSVTTHGDGGTPAG